MSSPADQLIGFLDPAAMPRIAAAERGAGPGLPERAFVVLSADQIFSMRQRGLNEAAARSLSVNGFINDLAER